MATEPGTPLSVTLTARPHWPKPAYTRRWPLFKRVHPILAAYPPIDYPFSIPLPDFGLAIRSVAHTRKHTRTRTHPRSNVLPASGGAFSRPMHHTHTCGGTFGASCARGILSELFRPRPLRASRERARAHTLTYTQRSPLSTHSTTTADPPPARVRVRV